MRIPSRKYLIGAAVLAALGAGVAEAASAKLHTMKVDAPDGSVVHVQYTGDVAPRVEILPADAIAETSVDPVAMQMADPFLQMERISAIMDAQMHAMMQRTALLQQQAAQMGQHAVAKGGDAAGAPGLTVVGDMPEGMHVTYYSSTTNADGCTRAVSYSSDGSGAAPKVIEAASDGCDAAKPNGATIPVKTEAPAKAPAVGQKV